MNLLKEWRTFRAILRRDLKLFASYKASLIATVIWPIPILATNIYQYLGLGPGSAVDEVLSRQYGISSLYGMVIIGTIVYLLYNRLLWGTGAAIQQERWMGTIEHLFLTPTSRPTILLASGIASAVEGSWWIVGVFLLSWGLFSVEVTVPSWPLLVLSLLSTVLALISVGIFFSGFFILTRAAEQLSVGLQAPIRYFTGVAFPATALPQLLQYVAYIFPMTYGIQALRKIALSGATLASVAHEIAMLYAFSAILVSLGYVLIKAVEKKAKRDGSLYLF